MTKRTEVYHVTHSFYDSILEYEPTGTVSQFLTDDVWAYWYQHIRESLMTQPAIERCIMHYMNDEDRYESVIELSGDLVWVTIYDTQGAELSELVLELFKQEIDGWDHYACGYFWRFGKSEDAIIQTPELWKHFEARFNRLGGMTTWLSKRLG